MTTRGPVDLDALTVEGIRAGELAGRPVTVLGLARSGLALARFLVDAGARVTAYDGRRAASNDGSTHNLTLAVRHRGLSVALSYHLNLEKVDEVPNDLFRLSVTYEF